MNLPSPKLTRRSCLYLAACVLALGGIGGAFARTLLADATIKLSVDFTDGAKREYEGLAWHDGMTVQDALAAAKAHSHGLSYSVSGAGPTAFLTDIEGEKNQGGGAGKKNWVYYLNSKMGDQGIGVKAVQAGDEVQWKFETYHDGAKTPSESPGQEKKKQ